MAIDSSSSSEIWNSSSRGQVSRMLRRRLPLWPSGSLPASAEHVLDLAADHRHLVGGRLVGLGGEQAHEPDLARRLAVGAVPAHADIVHVAATMDLGAQVRLGHHQGRAQQQVVANLGRQDRRLAAPAQHGQGLVAQHAQAALGLVQRLLGRVAAVGGARIFVDPGAQEHEAVAFQPVQEGQALGAFGLGDRPGRGAQFVDRAADQGLHGVEVVDRHLDVGQGVADAGEQGGLAVLAHRGQIDLDHRAATGRSGVSITGWNMARTEKPCSAMAPMMLSTRNGRSGWTISSRSLFRSVPSARTAGRTRMDSGSDAGLSPKRQKSIQLVGQVGGVEPGKLLGRPVLLDLGGELRSAAR
jgi:hypothetical protein